MTAAPAALPADLEAGLKRLKLATVRRIASEILQTATTQRWKPDEILRALIEAEIAARDEANRRGRHRQPGRISRRQDLRRLRRRRAGEVVRWHRALGIASHWAFNDWSRLLPEHTTATSLLDKLVHHAVVIVTDGESYRMRTCGGGPTT